MNLDNTGGKLICKFEGLKLYPYLDIVGVPTIGYGNTFYEDGTPVTMKDKPITHERALSLFLIIGNEFAVKVEKLITSALNQNQFNACLSLAYNIGIGAFEDSTLLKLVNKNPNDPNIRAQFLRWNRANRKIIKGLTVRRKEEADCYFKK